MSEATSTIYGKALACANTTCHVDERTIDARIAQSSHPKGKAGFKEGILDIKRLETAMNESVKIVHVMGGWSKLRLKGAPHEDLE